MQDMPRQTQTQTQPTRRMRGFERAVTLLNRDLRGPAEKRGFAEAKLLTRWAEIAGPDIAGIARPVEVKYGRGFGGTLVILTTGAHAPVLEMQKEKLIERVNACYGYHAIKDVMITQTAPTGFADGHVAFDAGQKPKKTKPDPKDLARMQPGLDRIEDTDLRAALAQMAGQIVTKTTAKEN